jgi:hypothetical protein
VSRNLKLPGTPIFRIFYWLMTLATFALLLYYLIPSKPNVKPVEIDWDDMKISFDQAQRVEAA